MNNFLLKLAALSLAKTFILGCIALGVYYVLLYDSGEVLQANLTSLTAQVAEQEAKQKESDKALREVEKIRSAVQALGEQYRAISNQIPTDNQMSDILKQIDSMAAASGVEIKKKEPQKAVLQDILEELPLRVSAEGTFAELVMFLYNMMNSERISRINNFNIFKAAVRGGVRNKKLIMDVQFANYRFVGETKNPPADAKKGGK